MHISEGVLSGPVVAGGFVVASGLSALALRKIGQDEIPRLSVMGAAFFVSSLIHVKVGFTSIHLTLVGLMGLVLGGRCVLAIAVGLLFQAVMFQHGGLSTLGVNTTVFALASLLVHYCFVLLARALSQRPVLLSLAAGLLTALAILFGAFLILAAILLSGEELAGLGYVFSAGQSVLALAEGIITGLVVRQLLSLKPQMLCAFRAS
jgi:cobalt/nickel transport system permease protein